MNTYLLRSKMALKGDFYVGDLAKLLDISTTTASKKLRGKIQLFQGEIEKMVERYGLTADDVSEIFLNSKCLKKTIAKEQS